MLGSQIRINRISNSNPTKLFSKVFKLILPVALVAIPGIAIAADSGGSRTDKPAAITVVSKSEIRKAYSGPGGVGGNVNVSAQNLYLTSSISKLPENVGDTFSISFTLKNDSSYPLNNVNLSSRYLSPNDSEDAVFKKLKTLHPGAWYTDIANYKYNGVVEPEELLMNVSANAQADPDRMITEIGWPYIAVRTKDHKVVDSKMPLIGPGIRSTVESKVSSGGYSAIRRFEVTAVFDKCPKAAGDKLNITFSILNGEKDPTYRLRGTSEKNTVRGVDENNQTRNFIDLYSNILIDPSQQEQTNLLHKFKSIGNSNNSDWTLPYTYKGKENLVALLSSIQVKSPLDKAPVGMDKAPSDFEYGVTRSGAIPLPDLCSQTPVQSSTTTPTTTAAPAPTTTTVTTAPPTPSTYPNPANIPSISVRRFDTQDGVFKYVVTNNGRFELTGLQVLDNQASSASFNFVSTINRIAPGESVQVTAKPLTQAAKGWECQVWYHEKDAPQGRGSLCTIMAQPTKN